MNKNSNIISRFIKNESNCGVMLIIATLLALIIANSPFEHFYFDFFKSTYFGVEFHNWSLKKPIYYWINDGLMAIFFLLIGLEIKRELITGELSKFKKAILPVLSAVGGMVFPAAIYLFVNHNNAVYANGWAIPIATDIAFALGILSLLGNKVPLQLKIFLISLAIIDDLGAILSIAIFYTEKLFFQYIIIALIGWLVLIIINILGYKKLWIYVVLGVLGIWLPLLLSGVHATIAGILVATAIPITGKIDSAKFIKNIDTALNDFKKHSFSEALRYFNTGQFDSIEKLKHYYNNVSSPLQILEKKLRNFSLFFIMPLFAFANTGIVIKDIHIITLVSNPLFIGVFFGLLIGKSVGITLFTYIALKLKFAKLSSRVSFSQIIGIGFLSGIGFTMSLFIAELSFNQENLVNIAKISILSTSTLSGIIGYTILSFSSIKRS